MGDVVRKTPVPSNGGSARGGHNRHSQQPPVPGQEAAGQRHSLNQFAMRSQAIGEPSARLSFSRVRRTLLSHARFTEQCWSRPRRGPAWPVRDDHDLTRAGSLGSSMYRAGSGLRTFTLPFASRRPADVSHRGAAVPPHRPGSAHAAGEYACGPRSYQACACRSAPYCPRWSGSRVSS